MFVENMLNLDLDLVQGLEIAMHARDGKRRENMRETIELNVTETLLPSGSLKQNS